MQVASLQNGGRNAFEGTHVVSIQVVGMIFQFVLYRAVGKPRTLSMVSAERIQGGNVFMQRQRAFHKYLGS